MAPLAQRESIMRAVQMIVEVAVLGLLLAGCATTATPEVPDARVPQQESDTDPVTEEDSVLPSDKPRDSGTTRPPVAPNPPKRDASTGVTAGTSHDAGIQGSASDGGERRDASNSTAVTDAGTEAPVDGPTTCPNTALKAGNTRATLQHGGEMRSFIVHVPAGYDNSRPVPLVLNFHGATMSASLQQTTTGMDRKADAEGFVVVYPDGIDRSWNAGVCCRGAASGMVDDVGFARALVEHVEGRVCIDPKRVYAAGFSNGGRMSYRLGCEAADLFAAIAPVAGTKSFPDLMNTPGCKPSRPISLIDVMGSDDPRIDAQPAQVAEWRAFNGCTDTEPKVSYTKGKHICHSYEQCAGGTSVTYCTVDGLGHAWPSGDFDANDRLWELFARTTL